MPYYVLSILQYVDLLYQIYRWQLNSIPLVEEMKHVPFRMKMAKQSEPQILDVATPWGLQPRSYDRLDMGHGYP